MKKEQKQNLRNIAAELGSRGGKALLKSRGKKYMRAIAKKGGQARWVNK